MVPFPAVASVSASTAEEEVGMVRVGGFMLVFLLFVELELNLDLEGVEEEVPEEGGMSWSLGRLGERGRW